MNKVAILIDGGFYIKRLPHVRTDIDEKSPEQVANSVRQLVRQHLNKLGRIQRLDIMKPGERKRGLVIDPNSYAQHYRTFYYDAHPLNRRTVTPKTRQMIDFSKTDAYRFRHELFDRLRKQRNLALRLGSTKSDPKYIWQLRPKILKALVDGRRAFDSLVDDDFTTTIRQKGVDMRMGLDMASIAIKKQANIIVLVTGDADFVPAAKLARREGCQIILDPMWQNVNPSLFEHIDGLDTAFYKDNADNGEDSDN